MFLWGKTEEWWLLFWLLKGQTENCVWRQARLVVKCAITILIISTIIKYLNYLHFFSHAGRVAVLVGWWLLLLDGLQWNFVQTLMVLRGWIKFSQIKEFGDSPDCTTMKFTFGVGNNYWMNCHQISCTHSCSPQAELQCNYDVPLTFHRHQVKVLICPILWYPLN